MASCRAFASASLGCSGWPIAVARIGPLPSTTRMTNGWILSPSAPGTNAGIRSMPISQVPPGLVPKPLGRCRGGAMTVIAIAQSCRRCWWLRTANPGRGWCRWTLINPGGSPGHSGLSCNVPPSMCISPRWPLDGPVPPVGHPCPALVAGGTREALQPRPDRESSPLSTLYLCCYVVACSLKGLVIGSSMP